MDNNYSNYKLSIGVKKAQLFKQLANRLDFILVISGIVLVAWAKNWEGNTLSSITPQVTGIFGGLSIASVLDTILYIMVTVLLPMFSKLADTVGRAEAFVIAITFYIMAGVVMACAQSMDALMGGQVLYAFGLSGVNVVGHILIADMTTKINRGLFQAFYDVPALINLYVSPIAGQALYQSGNWRWAYSLIPFCIGATSIPLFIGLYRVQSKARKSGLLEQYKRDMGKNNNQKMTTWEKIQWVLIEVDIIGSCLLAAGLCLFLVPFVLAVSRWGGWSSPTTLGTLISGCVLLVIFGFYEKKFATKPIIPLGSWATPTPITGVLTCATVSMFHASNWNYFLMYIQVTRGLDSTTANYVQNSYHTVFLLSQVLAGYLMKHFKLYRPIVFAGLSFMMVGMGMMIPARYPDSSMVFLIFSQVIAGFGAGFIYVPILVAVQSSVPHQDLAVVTALFQIGGTLATSIGSAIAGAIFTNLLPVQFAENIPGEYDYASLAGNLEAIAALPPDQHQGVITAYGNIQRIFSIVSLCFGALAFVFFLGMRSFGLTDDEINSDHEYEPSEKEKTLPSSSPSINGMIIIIIIKFD
ncbi:major facilitator superfamily domain-containing protein [Halteromyces radiatus]|uniref:major facilitator superfamily domain-containing protein n=1 Tax=Halteromyces radiatus TaxID=101107 RepID=UPI00221EE64A|nr:major facilitator superfamily domain-containing protein [Halteromyces radiatus]KAI8084501.1 major facilitator superfamily domain-containing protein [Halteromyces radiatus]